MSKIFSERASNQRLAHQVVFFEKKLTILALKIMTETTRENEVPPLKNLKPTLIMTSMKKPEGLSLEERFIDLLKIINADRNQRPC